MRAVSAKLFSTESGVSSAQIREFFCNETGPDVYADKLIAAQDWRRRNVCNLPNGVFKIFVPFPSAEQIFMCFDFEEGKIREIFFD